MEIAVSKGRKIWPSKNADCDLEHACRWIFYQVAEGMQYLHDVMCIVHRDLKHENILLGRLSADPQTEEEAQPTIKICDFTTAYIMPEPTDDCKLVTKAGTIAFNAPEVFSQETFLAKPLDIWSYGVSMFVFLTKKLPVSHMTEDFEKVIQKFNFADVIQQNLVDKVSNDLIELL